MTVIELVRQLLACDDLNARVLIGKGVGPLGALTETVNSFVILDPLTPEGMHDERRNRDA